MGRIRLIGFTRRISRRNSWFNSKFNRLIMISIVLNLRSMKLVKLLVRAKIINSSKRKSNKNICRRNRNWKNRN